MFYDSELPEHGWFQRCMGCDQVTGKLSLYKKTLLRTGEEVEIYSYLCAKCKNKLQDIVFLENYEKVCNEYIKDQLSQTLRLHETFV